MKKMICGTTACEAEVTKDFVLMGRLPAGYRRETIVYAVERFLTHSTVLCRNCTHRSWKLRLAKGKERRPVRFRWVVPALLLELPGRWVRLSGRIDAVGVKVEKVELLRDYPGSAGMK